MLVLSRRLNEKIEIPDINATIQVVALKSGVVRLGFIGPKDLKIFRAEIFDPEAWKNDPRRRQQDVKAMIDRFMHSMRNRINSTTLASALLRQQYDRGLYEEMERTLQRLEEEVKQMQDALTETTQTQQTSPGQVSEVKPRALIVEDDLNECELLAGLLRVVGMDVDAVNDGEDALEYLYQKEESHPDFVLMDMMLPRCDGLTAARSIRENPSFDQMKIFAVTGMTPDSLHLDAEARLIDRWFQKPLSPEALLGALQRASEH